jgi:hypothetical protein
MGSGGWNGSTGRSSYTGRNSTGQWATPAEFKEERGPEFRNGAGYRRGESGADAVPQFLVEADDLYDDEYGESRLVAPPVLGEAPPNYRDF